MGETAGQWASETDPRSMTCAQQVLVVSLLSLEHMQKKRGILLASSQWNSKSYLPLRSSLIPFKRSQVLGSAPDWSFRFGTLLATPRHSHTQGTKALSMVLKCRCCIRELRRFFLCHCYNSLQKIFIYEPPELFLVKPVAIRSCKVECCLPSMVYDSKINRPGPGKPQSLSENIPKQTEWGHHDELAR